MQRHRNDFSKKKHRDIKIITKIGKPINNYSAKDNII
jgi:hypothetical protein